MTLPPILRRCVPTFALALLLGMASASGGDAATQGPGPRLKGLLDAVGSPAREEAVRDLLAEPEVWTKAGGQAAAGALWHAGGHAAAQGLCRLLKHTDPAVLRAALDGLAAVDVRVAGVSAVRR